MRLTVLFLCLMLASPAAAQSWDRYANARFGYVIEAPPGYVGGGESDNGDGQVFRRAESGETLRVWGGNLMEDFAAETGQRRDGLTHDGWTLSYRAQNARWASFSGTRADRIVYLRLIRLCDGTSYAAFQSEYPAADAARMRPVVERLTRSFASRRC